MPDGETPSAGVPLGPLRVPRWAVALLPLALLAAAVAWVVLAAPLAGVQTGEPLPDVTVTHATLPNDETVVLHVVNNGPESVTVSQVLVDDAYWEFRVAGSADSTLAPLERARIVVPYHWTPDWDLHTTLVLAGGATVHHIVVAPQPTPGLTPGLLWTLAVVGLLVGLVPVVLGVAWYPLLRAVPDRTLHAVLAFAGGVLAFLAVDAGFEALELAAAAPGAYQGEALVVFAAAGTALALQGVATGGGAGGAGGEGSGDAATDGGTASGAAGTASAPSPLRLAALVAVAIGLHNLAEGLAIGAAVAAGHVSLGTFLVVGFMLHNVTEGPAVVAPLARGERPRLWQFAVLGAVAGAPVVLGGWLGSVARSPTHAAVCFAAGVGAIVQVCWTMAGQVRREGRLATPANLLAVAAGLAVMYATGLLVAV
ncbi:MAG: ZIP family metal transporter [Halobacteriaceae archaeon]